MSALVYYLGNKNDFMNDHDDVMIMLRPYITDFCEQLKTSKEINVIIKFASLEGEIYKPNGDIAYSTDNG